MGHQPGGVKENMVLKGYRYIFYLLYRLSPQQHRPYIFATYLLCFFLFFHLQLGFMLWHLLLGDPTLEIQQFSDGIKLFTALSGVAVLAFNTIYFLRRRMVQRILIEFKYLDKRRLLSPYLILMAYFLVLLFAYLNGFSHL